MKLFVVEFDAARLDGLGEADRSLLFSLCHALNEISLLQKWTAFAGNGLSGASGVEQTVQVAQHSFLLRLLAGKLYAVHELLERAAPKKDYPQWLCGRLTADAAAALREFAGYFKGKKSLAQAVRHKYGFHYDGDRARAASRFFPQGEACRVFVAEHHPNCYYEFSETAHCWGVLNLANPASPAAGMDQLLAEVAERLPGLFVHFATDLAETLLAQAGVDLSECERQEQVEAARLDNVRLPYFVERKESPQLS